jgi:cation transport regulator
MLICRLPSARICPNMLRTFIGKAKHAFAAHRGEARQEEAAHRIAWAAVKRSYVKVGNSWIARHP